MSLNEPIKGALCPIYLKNDIKAIAKIKQRISECSCCPLLFLLTNEKHHQCFLYKKAVLLDQ